LHDESEGTDASPFTISRQQLPVKPNFQPAVHFIIDLVECDFAAVRPVDVHNVSEKLGWRRQITPAFEIDFVDDLIGASFRINNPQATASCGCGTSFSL